MSDKILFLSYVVLVFLILLLSFVILFYVGLFIFLLSSEIFVYSWSVSFMRCMIWKYFISVACLFILLTVSLKENSFNFDDVQYISFIINHVFVVTTMFPSGCFIVLGFTFNLIMHLENIVYFGRCISRMKRKSDISVISMNVRHLYSKSLSSLILSLSIWQFSLLDFKIHCI